jgi:hypothetical protein
MSSAGTNGTNGTDLGTTLTTQGDIVYRSASGLARLGAGTNGQVLTTAGSGANPSWSTVSSDYVLLATTTASSSASISFDGYFSSTYDNYIIYAYGLYAATGGSTFKMRFRRSNADVSASNYTTIANNHQTAGTDGQFITSQSSFDLTAAGAASFSATSTDNNCFRIQMFNPLDTTTHKTMIFHGWVKRNDGNLFTTSGSGQLSDNANALSGVSFFMNSGNIAGGKFKLYGVK